MEEQISFEAALLVKWFVDKEYFFKTKNEASKTITPEALDKVIKGRQYETLLKNFSPNVIRLGE